MDSEDRSTQKDTSSSAVTSSLSDLIARLEKATGPDRELDAHIAASVGLPMMFCDFDTGCYHGDCISPGCGKPLGLTDERRSYPNDWRDDERLPHFTSSIDAAMTLVPKGMEKDFTDLYGVARVSVGINAEPGPFYGTHEGGSLAIALCIAALRARSQIESLPANDSAETRLEI